MRGVSGIAMIKTFLVAGAALLAAVQAPGAARADAVISGPACVHDGNTLQIGGSMKKDKCWGGIDVRLHGSIAPRLTATCTDSAGGVWKCGEIAKTALIGLIRRRSISCYHIDGEFDGTVPVVTCISGRRDLALDMVTKGLAKALHDQSKRYEIEEKDAIKNKRGLWR